jgi:hypothetical protein
LVRFCDQLVRLCCRDAAPLFQKLCTSNAKDLAFEESIPALIKVLLYFYIIICRVYYRYLYHSPFSLS